jgi:molybdate transport system substrate-binding protein
LALWSPNPNLIDAQGNILRTGKFNKLAIANPMLAPYGVAAMDVLRHLNLEESIRNSLVTGENIAQTYQFVSTGNADMGFVALSQIMKDGQISSGSAWRVPTNLYRAIKQDAVLLKKAEDNTAAKEFMAFLKGVKAQKIILSYGYQILE